MAHPFVETAQLLEHLLSEQRRHDRRGDGVIIFASEYAEDRAREEAKYLRHAAEVDAIAAEPGELED